MFNHEELRSKVPGEENLAIQFGALLREADDGSDLC